MHASGDDDALKPLDASASGTGALLGRPRGAPVIVGTFVLANTILGAGMLGLPAAFGGCGYVAGCLMIFLFAGSATFGLHLLSEAANFVGRPATFHKVADAALPGFGLLFDAAIAIKCFGVATSYFVVVKGNVPKALTSFGVPDDSVWHAKWLWVLIAAGLASPLAALKQISKLRFTAGLSLTCVVLIVTVACLFALHPAPSLDPCDGGGGVNGSQPCKGAVVPFTDVVSCLRELPIFVFAYTCHQNIISITNELERPSTGRALAGMSSAVSIAVVAYLVLAFAGYSTYGDLVASDVLESYPEGSRLVGVARLAVSLIVTLCYPLQAHPSRGCITSIIVACGAKLRHRRSDVEEDVGYAPFERRDERRDERVVNAAALRGVVSSTAETAPPTSNALAITPPAAPPADDHGGVQPSSNAMHYGITSVFVCASVAIALAVDDLGLVLKVVGATGSTTVSYILPGATYLRVAPPSHRGGLQWWGALLILIAGCIIMPLSLTLDFMPEPSA